MVMFLPLTLPLGVAAFQARLIWLQFKALVVVICAGPVMVAKAGTTSSPQAQLSATRRDKARQGATRRNRKWFCCGYADSRRRLRGPALESLELTGDKSNMRN